MSNLTYINIRSGVASNKSFLGVSLVNIYETRK